MRVQDFVKKNVRTIGREASIGPDCVIGPFAVVPRQSIVPEGTTILRNVSEQAGM